MPWIYLLIASVFEIIWAYTMKLSNGFTRLDMSAITIVTALASFVFLSYAMKTIPLGTAYAIWTGIGAVGTFVVGIIFLGEAISLLRIVSILLIAAGLAGLKLSS